MAFIHTSKLLLSGCPLLPSTPHPLRRLGNAAWKKVLRMPLGAGARVGFPGVVCQGLPGGGSSELSSQGPRPGWGGAGSTRGCSGGWWGKCGSRPVLSDGRLVMKGHASVSLPGASPGPVQGGAQWALSATQGE